MRKTWRRSLASTLLLASVVGTLTTGCIVAAGDDHDGWRSRDRDRYERWDRRDPRGDRRYEYRDGRWWYREPAY